MSAKPKSGFVSPSELMAQVRAQGGGARPEELQPPSPGAQKLDPKLIRPSRWANRHPDSFTSADFTALRDEISNAGGNVQPVKVRPRPGDDGTQYELVFGHRRHRACADLGLQVLAVVEEVSDAELYVQMERENRGRANLSAWEQGAMYARALDAGLFPSNRRLADAVGVDVSAIGKALRIARLPAEVVAAFPSPTAIQFRWGQNLAAALELNEAAVLAEAQQLAGADLPAAAVFARLEAAAANGKKGGRTVLPPAATKLDFGTAGHAEFSKDGREVRLKLSAALPPKKREALERALRKVLGEA